MPMCMKITFINSIEIKKITRKTNSVTNKAIDVHESCFLHKGNRNVMKAKSMTQTCDYVRENYIKSVCHLIVKEIMQKE